jgi:hypothetical protein
MKTNTDNSHLCLDCPVEPFDTSVRWVVPCTAGNHLTSWPKVCHISANLIVDEGKQTTYYIMHQQKHQQIE